MKILPILALVSVLSLAGQNSHAKCYDDETDMVYYGYRYYNPSGGRWLSRDPVSEVAFSRQNDAVLDLAADIPQSGGNQYAFCDNQSVSEWDYLGLLIAKGGVPTRGIFEHNSYLTFTVTCPPHSEFVFLSVDYSGAVPALESLFGKNRVDSLAGPIPPADGLGGFRDYPNGHGPNCDGTPVQINVFMRTRFTSLTFAPTKGAAGAAAYAAGTFINYDCIPCPPPCSILGPGNPILPWQPWP